MWLLSLRLDFLLLPLHLPPVCLPFFFFHLSDEQQPELNKKIMENLCDSANNGGEGTYDVFFLTTHLEWKKQDTISVMPEFLQHCIAYLCCSRTHWRKFGRTRVDGSCRNTFQLETILTSPRMIIQFEVNLGEKDDKLCSSLSWVLGETTVKTNPKVSCRNKERYTTEWKRAQDAVYWIHLSNAQENITFWVACALSSVQYAVFQDTWLSEPFPACTDLTSV